MDSKKTMECPFTWDINKKLIDDFYENEEVFINIDEQQILSLINALMITYIYAMKNDYNKAKIKMEEVMKIEKDLNLSEIEEEKISLDVLHHIVMATKYHLYKIVNNKIDEKIYNELKDANKFASALEMGTINGCKSIAWSSFHEAAHTTSLHYAEIALKYIPDCPLWNFMVGKNYRYSRRMVDFSKKPTAKEMNSYLKCYKLSKNPFYGIHVAHIYYENKDFKNFKKIYLNIYEQKCKSIVIQLRLAKAFIVSGDFKRAETCLDYLQKMCPNDSMFLHYKGMYFKKKKEYETAVNFLKEAAKLKNYGADMDYILCMIKLDKKNNAKNFDCIEHFKIMLERYENKYYRQQINLHLAMNYYFENDFSAAKEYFIKSIEINPDADIFKNYRNITGDWKCYNIINFINDELVPKLENLNASLTVDENKILRAFKKIQIDK